MIMMKMIQRFCRFEFLGTGFNEDDDDNIFAEISQQLEQLL